MNKEQIETVGAVIGVVAGALGIVYWTLTIRKMIKDNKETV